MRPFLLPLAAASLVLMPLPADAATAVVRYQYDDGTRESEIHLDAAEGARWLSTRMDLHPRHVQGLQSATLYVSLRDGRCDVPAPSYDRLFVNDTPAVDFDPCRYGTAGHSPTAFGIPVGLLRAGENTFRFEDLDGGGSAYFGIDTDGGGHSSAQGGLQGELMALLILRGEIPSMWITPYDDAIVVDQTFSLGTHDPGTSHSKRLYVLYNGPEAYPITSIGLSGPDAGDFAITSDGCTGTAMAHNTSCPFAVTFAPGAVGPRTATLTVTGEGGVTSVATLNGYGRVAPPVSTITTPDGTILLPFGRVTGTVTDDGAVAREYVRFSSGLQMVTVQAALACNAARTACDWSAEVPLGLPGPYTVTAWGLDSHENDERPGPSISAVVL